MGGEGGYYSIVLRGRGGKVQRWASGGGGAGGRKILVGVDTARIPWVDVTDVSDTGPSVVGPSFFWFSFFVACLMRRLAVVTLKRFWGFGVIIWLMVGLWALA